MPNMKASRGFGCEVRTIWGHPQHFESIGICVMSLAQECEVRVPWVPGHGTKKIFPPILFRFRHNVLDWTALPWNFLASF